MKKFISIVALATALCATVFAQENGNRDAQGKIVRGPYVTNRFFDNTFVELQGGVNLMFSGQMGQDKLQPSVALDANIGKWFNPNFGLRLGWNGLNTSILPSLDGAVKQLHYFNYTHADFLVNISNWFSGYKETRVWDFVPYVGLGWVNTGGIVQYGVLNKLGVNAGLYNKIRLTDRVGLSLDLRVTGTDRKALGALAYANVADKGNFGYVGSALVGVHVNLGKTGWVRQNPTDLGLSGNGNGNGNGLDLGQYIGAAKKDAKMQALQAQADKSVASAQSRYNAAALAYQKASVTVDADGKVTPAAYNCDPELAAAYADMANYEDCPDFTTMSRAEKDAWDKSHKDILPEGWKKMTPEQKNQWVAETIYNPAQQAIDEKEAAARELSEARAEMKAAAKDCNDAVVLAQWFVDDAAKRIDANGNVTPACYPGVDAATAQKYADIANTEACPDFTKMTKKEARKWAKAHKDILPKGWNRLTAEQKNDWLVDNIYGNAFQAKADASAAKEELEIAQARKLKHDQNLEAANRTLDKETVSDGVGYFTIGKSEFNAKQLANWKKSIKKYNKAGNYTVTGYADKETGTPARNAALRVERANYVAKLLKENGFTGEITATPSTEKEKFVNYPIWKNRSAVLK